MAESKIEMGILVIDDDPKICETLEKFFKARGHRVQKAGSGLEGLAILEREAIDVVITDYQMPDMNGLEVVRLIKKTQPEAETIVITGYGDMELAVQAMRAGAFDFFSKPLNIPDLVAALERTTRFYKLRAEKNRYRDRLMDLENKNKREYGLDAIVGKSPVVEQMKQKIRDVSQTDATTVLICGETGTGKELVASAIHYESARAGGPFVAVDCTSIPEALAESELFGHVKGAFTDARSAHKGRFEQAEGGTLFLDEIADMPLSLQARLLRVLEQRYIMPLGSTKEVAIHVRVISATNRDLRQEVAKGRVREDLFHRLNTVTIDIPPLRERCEDIDVLAQIFLDRYTREMRKTLRGFSEAAKMRLVQYPFPGNIRELRNVIEQAVIFCKRGTVFPDDLKFQTVVPHLDAPPQDNPFAKAPACQTTDISDLDLDALEKAAIQEALRRCSGNQHHAADLLGITRFALRRRMDRYGIK